MSRYPDTSLDEIAKTLEALGSALAGKKMNELRNLEFQAKNFVELFRQMKDTTLAIDAREELSQEFPFRQNRVLDALTDVDRVCNK